ncbi:hypothetical protein [Bosea sp. TND4EK4]|uniref:hypothetical protein n=1 Tax=Bosea sp. TND4EK4 TaxID=1907408 RepID=UPI0011156A8D|nr:hypothetical protein [Bosea sp. TND4EK4]
MTALIAIDGYFAAGRNDNAKPGHSVEFLLQSRHAASDPLDVTCLPLDVAIGGVQTALQLADASLKLASTDKHCSDDDRNL